MRRAFLVLPLILVACGTPQERCINQQTRDLRVVEGLIADTQRNLDRGYAVEEYTVTTVEWQPCDIQGAGERLFSDAHGAAWGKHG